MISAVIAEGIESLYRRATVTDGNFTHHVGSTRSVNWPYSVEGKRILAKFKVTFTCIVYKSVSIAKLGAPLST